MDMREVLQPKNHLTYHVACYPVFSMEGTCQEIFHEKALVDRFYGAFTSAQNVRILLTEY